MQSLGSEEFVGSVACLFPFLPVIPPVPMLSSLSRSQPVQCGSRMMFAGRPKPLSRALVEIGLLPPFMCVFPNWVNITLPL